MKEKKMLKTKKTKYQSKKAPAKKSSEKRELHVSDTDFESSRPSNNAKKKESPIKKEKKKTSGKGILLHEKQMFTRVITLENPLVEQTTKKRCRYIGFRSVLKMKMTDIPLKIGFYIFQQFDYERMVIDVERMELKLFYDDKIHLQALTVTRKRPTICYWSLEKIMYRETFEQEIGRFGLGELNEECVNEQDEGDTDLEHSDCDKDEDDWVEAYESKLSKMLDSFERIMEKMNSKLNDAITKFPERKITNITVEEKTESTYFFGFPSNETGLEGINLTPIMRQKTNDEKENEDKEANGEEDNDNNGSQPKVEYLLDGNEVENEGIKNDGDNNKKEGETEVKEKNGEINENENHEEKNDDETKETNNHGETSQQMKQIKIFV
uniref:Uncharacterized protein n=1 Tax=Lactuca sativa TaxID=4236 RepID=A0A9R1VZD3_LACSA|nr:hypothetical protein LSAT_V11C400189490 [Lactuca sativa]